jgi:hypothetical protein
MITTVAPEIDISGDVPAQATEQYGLVVLAAAEYQHVGEPYAGEVLRVRMVDRAKDEPPSLEEMKRAQQAAERVAFRACPFGVPFSIFQKFVPKVRGAKPVGLDDQREVDLTLPEVEPYRSTKVLVTCAEGLNRSAYIAAMACVLTGCCASGAEAVEHIRTVRGPEAFVDGRFATLLRSYYPESLKDLRGPSADDVRARGGFTLRNV